MGTNYFVFVSLSLLHYFQYFYWKLPHFERGSMTVPFLQRISLIIFSGGFRISQTECTNIRCGRYQYSIWQNSYKNERNWTEGVPPWRPLGSDNNNSKLTLLSLLLSLGVKVNLYHLKCRVSLFMEIS